MEALKFPEQWRYAEWTFNELIAEKVDKLFAIQYAEKDILEEDEFDVMHKFYPKSKDGEEQGIYSEPKKCECGKTLTSYKTFNHAGQNTPYGSIHSVQRCLKVDNEDGA